MFKEHTRRTVQLGNDHTFGTVNYKRAARCHQRDFTHVHFVFTHFFNGRLGRLFIQNHQADARTQRGGISNTTQLAFRDIKQRFTQSVMNELQTGITIMADNRENRAERCLQAFVVTTVKRLLLLQELSVRIQLGGEQERYFQYILPFRKALADTLFLGKRITHCGKLQRMRTIQRCALSDRHAP